MLTEALTVQNLPVEVAGKLDTQEKVVVWIQVQYTIEP